MISRAELSGRKKVEDQVYHEILSRKVPKLVADVSLFKTCSKTSSLTFLIENVVENLVENLVLSKIKVNLEFTGK